MKVRKKVRNFHNTRLEKTEVTILFRSSVLFYQQIFIAWFRWTHANGRPGRTIHVIRLIGGPGTRVPVFPHGGIAWRSTHNVEAAKRFTLARFN